MKLTGFTDEAGKSLEAQIKVSKELGWKYLSARMIGDKNIHELPEAEFDKVCESLSENQLQVAEFGSLIGNWSKSISSDWSITVGEIERAIPRMKTLGTQYVRVMSYAQEPWGEEQFEQERFKRLREIVSRFADAGLTAIHENCMNWGGFSADHTLKLIEEVPGLKLVFDTGNPVFQRDRSKQNAKGHYPWQNALEFYQKVKEHVVHIHIKDCIMHAEEGEPEYVWPGEGQGYVKEILNDLKADNYQGFIAIEPHVAKVFHLSDQKENAEHEYQSYLEYGKRMEALLGK